jgi:hypothetical protein
MDVPDDSCLVVVAVRAQRPAQAGVGVFVPLAARQPPSVRAATGIATRAAADDFAALLIGLACTGPKEGAVKVANTTGWMATDSGTPLPPASPARMS